jgi:antitoxin VapB
MPILIRDPTTDALVRDLARRTGETLTEAVRKAVETRLACLPSGGKVVDRAAVDAILAGYRTLDIAEPTSDDDALGYDDLYGSGVSRREPP